VLVHNVDEHFLHSIDVSLLAVSSCWVYLYFVAMYRLTFPQRCLQTYWSTLHMLSLCDLILFRAQVRDEAGDDISYAGTM
jgi:hypothetical protein